MIHVLVVEDEAALLRALVLNLTNRGYRVSSAGTGATAIARATAMRPELVLLDLGLPDMDGLDVIAQVHATQPGSAILVLSARTGSQDKVSALSLGAVDYITKPFDMNELVARLRAAAGRANIIEPRTVATLGAITIDLTTRRIQPAEGKASDGIHLTPTEWRMLEVLVRNPGTLITSAELLLAMRGDPDHSERSYLRIYMQQLRRKLEPDPSRPRYFLTELGMGYRYVP